jgi:hypothetical protein
MLNELILFNTHVIYKFMCMFCVVTLPDSGVDGRGRYNDGGRFSLDFLGEGWSIGLRIVWVGFPLCEAWRIPRDSISATRVLGAKT